MPPRLHVHHLMHSVLLQVDAIKLPIQVNGKMRGTVDVPPDVDQEGALRQALELASVQRLTSGKEIKKIIFVPGKILNIIAK